MRNSTHQSNMMRTLLLGLASFAMMAAVTTSTASAAGPQLDLNGKFKRLSAQKSRGVLTIDYKISKRSWNNMLRANIRPRLNISLPNAKKTRYVYTYSTRIKSRKGRLVYPRMNLRSFSTVQVRLVGYEGAYRVATTSLGRSSGRAVRIPMVRVRPQVQNPPVHAHPPVHTHPPTHTHPPRRPNWRAQAINACKANTKFNSDFNSCVSRAVKLNATDAATVVNACGRATRMGSGLAKCLDVALVMPGRRSDTIAACDAYTKFDSDLTNCLSLTKVYKYTAANVVRACGAQTKFSSELRSCIKTASVLSFNHASRTVTACGKATRSSNALNRCVKQSPALGRSRYSIIEACGNSTRFDSGFATCINNSSGRRRARPASIRL